MTDRTVILVPFWDKPALALGALFGTFLIIRFKIDSECLIGWSV